MNLDSNVKIPNWRDINTIIFDFDGVFTNNKVYVDQNGAESICCDRSDGLGIDILRKFKRWELIILSTEKTRL